MRKLRLKDVTEWVQPVVYPKSILYRSLCSVELGWRIQRARETRGIKCLWLQHTDKWTASDVQLEIRQQRARISIGGNSENQHQQQRIHRHGLKPSLLGQRLLRLSARYTVPYQPCSRRRAVFVCNLPNHHSLCLCNQSELIKTNISESAMQFLFFTVGCVVGEHTDGVSFLNEMFWQQPLLRVFPCFHLGLVLERTHKSLEKENSVGVLNH